MTSEFQQALVVGGEIPAMNDIAASCIAACERAEKQRIRAGDPRTYWRRRVAKAMLAEWRRAVRGKA